MIVLSFILTLGGSVGLCLSKTRHYKQFWNNAPEKGRASLLKYIGWGLVLSAMGICMNELGGPIGFVTWLGMFTGCSVSLIFLLPYLPPVEKKQVRKARRVRKAA